MGELTHTIPPAGPDYPLSSGVPVVAPPPPLPLKRSPEDAAKARPRHPGSKLERGSGGTGDGR